MSISHYLVFTGNPLSCGRPISEIYNIKGKTYFLLNVNSQSLKHLFMPHALENENMPELQDNLNFISQDSAIFIEKSMAISKRIFFFMTVKEWKQKDLADKMGKTEAEISKLLSGTHNYTLRTLSKIEAVLNEVIIDVADVRFK